MFKPMHKKINCYGMAVPVEHTDTSNSAPEQERFYGSSYTLTEYERLAMRTDPPHESSMEGLLNAALGMCGEAGEFADLLKKIRYHKHPMDKEHLLKECGDVLWYVAQAAYYLSQIYEDEGITLGLIGEMNIQKLKDRYPDGFDSDKSLHRKEGDI